MSLDLEQGRLLAGDAIEYRLGELIAEGGEGIVYRVQGRDDLVAKLYKDWQYGRDKKLGKLIALKSSYVTRYSAWPLSMLRDENDEMVGFVMERLDGWQPLHAIYQIRSRLEHSPNRTYQFLVRTARNLAVCVHHVHEGGIIVGDLNESNVFVGRDAMVKLLDVDSFQVRDGDELFPCKVGKAELIAPELQGHSLERLERTRDHDRFSLAVLIFGVLVFGRHPFAGRPTHDEEVPLEEAVARSWYAYTTRRDVPVKPPPGLNLNFLPPKIREMFEEAFDPDAPTRPTSMEWYEALKELEDSLTPCPDNGGHVFWRELKQCPWCELESKWNVPLFLPSLPTLSTGEPIDSEAIWNRVNALAIPNQIPPPEVVDYADLPPAELPKWQRVIFSPLASDMPWWILVPLATASRDLWVRAPWILGVIVVVIAAIMSASLLVVGPIRRRVKNATAQLARLRSEWDRSANPEILRAAVLEIDRIRQQLGKTEERMRAARERKIRTVHAAQLDRYLEKYSILAADAGPIGSSKLSYLHDRGFRTAADITEERVNKGRDTDETFWRELLGWRHRLETQFWATSSFPLTPIQERDVMLSVLREDTEMRKRLMAAEQDLNELRNKVIDEQARIAAAAAPLKRTLSELGPRLSALENKI